MKGRAVFGAAIRSVGGTARLCREGGKEPFAASVQPAFYLPAPSGSPAGAGDARRFHLYAAWDPVAQLMEARDIVEWQGRRYEVRRVETAFLKGQAVYRKASLRLCSPEVAP